jgi:hypothetical protein
VVGCGGGGPQQRLSSVNIAQGTYDHVLTSWGGSVVLGGHLVCPNKIFHIMTYGARKPDMAPDSVYYYYYYYYYYYCYYYYYYYYYYYSNYHYYYYYYHVHYY